MAQEQCHFALDFDEWIATNSLQEIKPLLFKHDLTSRTNLSTQSVQFAAFISDPLLFETKQHLISATVQAIQKVSLPVTPRNNTTNYIVISEKEENVLKSLQLHLDGLQSYQKVNDDLTEKYSKSIQHFEKRKQIKIDYVTNQTETRFDKLINHITLKKSSLLSQLASFTNADMDQKEMHILSKSEVLIKKQKESLTDAIESINNIIQSSFNQPLDERKQEILRIGNEVSEEYSERKCMLNANFELIKTAIQDVDSAGFDINIDLKVDVESMIQMIEAIQNMVHGNGMHQEEGPPGCHVSNVNYEEVIETQRMEIIALQRMNSELKSKNMVYLQELNDVIRKSNKIKSSRNTQKPNYVHVMNTATGLWKVTMTLNGKKVVANGNSKLNGENNCRSKFSRQYGSEYQF